MSTIPLHRPWHRRLLDRSLADAIQGLGDAWQSWKARRRERLETEALAEMNELMLRDIGAPDWMVARAAAQRDAQDMRMFELEFARDVDRMRGLK